MEPPALPPAPRRARSPRLLIGIALCTFALSTAAMVRGIEPFAGWFYVFAWWSYILLLDGWIHLRRGSSMLLSRPKAFLFLLPWSCLFWLFFEVVNWRLGNWYYVGVPPDLFGRFFGIFISFATVLPGVLETADLFGTFGIAERRRCSAERWRITATRRRAITGLGLAFLVLPLVFPRSCFPLIWGATVLLAEPFLAGRGEPSLWTHLAAGRPAVPLRLLLAGVLCGLCWESWNFWAASKWIYTVPYFEQSKLFEMPFAGFLGFPPFALECYTFSRLLVALGLVPEWDPTAPLVERTVRARGAWGLVAGLACLPLIVGVVRWTVRATALQLEELTQLDPARVALLEERGCTTPSELATSLSKGELDDLFSAEQREALTRELTLARTALMGHRGVAWLASIGVRDVSDLTSVQIERLLALLDAEGEGPGPRPTPPEIRVWWRAARGFAQSR